ncbi:DUF6210 family protein [Kitasatospora cheerisanensis]|uniref:Uncharacterized protein n=1 Tax=Kitasatospora cheerisanensis KCTC 2395 TaxID=1348663 RepID=A0A066Z9Y6_9ACTN|nr:DUF6210 family protein [Kitasatospora cheerisanensis]KDN86975.1 hypothetical protein KCH_10600 [Kitasatospora cheerisanensis KCTC 2395]
MTEAEAGKRHIVLDPDGCGADQGWMFVIVAAPTGVVYQNQGGGYGCLQYQQEGYLIPLFGPDLDEALQEIFVGELKGCGSRRLDWPPALLDRLRMAVDQYGVYGSGRHEDTFPTPLVLDESRLSEVDEAWVPVLTPDGPGVLVWENSD